MYKKDIGYGDVDTIRGLFIGRKIVKVDISNETMTLDNGTTLKIMPNEGCGGCTIGQFKVDRLADFDNVITSVELKTEYKGPKDVFSINVYSEADFGEVLSVSGDVGDGYYGTGYKIHVVTS